MKIAIVGPSPVPFTMGGMENLIMGLYQTINQETEHQAELIKLPTREFSFWELIDSYYQFYSLDLSYFDLVISNKYPAWMVQHDNCIFYVAHRLRGLYDTYHLMKLPYEVEKGNYWVDDLLNYMEKEHRPTSLEVFFQKVFNIRDHIKEIPGDYFAFPGPLIRKVVHYMDDFAFDHPKKSHYCAISQTVKERADYFPHGAKIEIIPPPSELKNFRTGEYKHLFIVSRLDAPKRLDMLIRAMQYVKSRIPLYIAGTGPERNKLEELAKEDDRIHFLGFVSDAEVEKYYADSLVIPYFPYDEDYGLITIEAMMHRKPVITTEDAGGPTEFVKSGETGFCVKYDAREIAKKIDYFAEHPEEAERMGKNGYEAVKNITWKSVVDQLLHETAPAVRRRKKITVTSTFPIYPPQGGGQARIYNLYRELARNADIEIVSYTNFDQQAYQGEIAEHLRETRIPRSREHQEKIWSLEKKAGFTLSDIAEITLGAETKSYCDALKRALKESDLYIVSHPYLYTTAEKFLKDIPFVYEAQDIESTMKQSMLPESKIKAELIKQVFDTEKECCERSALIMTCSEEDRQKLHEIYQTPLDKIIVVPNGVNTKATSFVGVEERKENKKRLGLSGEKIGLFMGSWHGPNLDACEMIFEIAKLCPDTKFMLMGSQCQYFKDREVPDNVAMLGLVSEETKNRVFSAVDFALNPMLSGSGTNLKMFDYMSAGIPVISTNFGTRGIDRKDLFILADTVEETAQAINHFSCNAQTVAAAREYVEHVFDWRVIAKTAMDRICSLC